MNKKNKEFRCRICNNVLSDKEGVILCNRFGIDSSSLRYCDWKCLYNDIELDKKLLDENFTIEKSPDGVYHRCKFCGKTIPVNFEDKDEENLPIFIVEYIVEKDDKYPYNKKIVKNNLSFCNNICLRTYAKQN